jgi:hypothetical protein
MTEISESALRNLLNRIQERQNGLYDQVGYHGRSQPGPPASREQIRQTESALGCTFPRSYRAFLAVNDGWKHWSGDVTLLSTNEMLRGRYARRIQEWRKNEKARGNPLADHSLVVGFSLFVGEQILIDFGSPNKEETVIWDKGQMETFPNFYEYLVHFKSVVETDGELYV